MIEYLMISAVIMALFIVMLLLVNTYIMEGPANRVIYVSFTDIGNGVSTRIVGRGYFVNLGSNPNSADQDITVSRDYLNARIALAGIGVTRGVNGSTTGAGMNIISYNSSGFL
jgi:hypothetical protein